MSTSEPDGANLPDGGRSGLDIKLTRLYGARMPRSLDARVAQALAAGNESSRREVRSRYTWRFVRLGAILVTLTAALVGGAYSAGNILNLGKPVDIQSTNQHFPLSGFHRIKTNLRSHGKTELLFIGALAHEGRVSAERWPLVKALEQFGSFSRVRPIADVCDPIQGGGAYCPAPSYDLSRAKYVSKYVVFENRDLIRLDVAKKTMVRYQPLKGSARTLFNKYARYQSGTSSGFVTMVEATMDNSQSTHTLPLIAVGHYIQTISQVISPGDFQTTHMLTPSGQVLYTTDSLTFDQARKAIQTENDPNPTSRLVEDTNAEANIITALICRADGASPASVCGRATIRAILRHVK